MDDLKTKKSIKQSNKYFLSKNNNKYKFKISKREYQILIKSGKYELLLHHKDLQILTKAMINSRDESYKYISSLFEEKNVQIGKIKEMKHITLILKIFIYNKQKKIKLILNYQNKVKDNNKDKDKIKMLYNIDQGKENGENIIVNYQEQNKNIEKEKNICKISEKINDSYAYDNLDNTFIIFKTINDRLYLIYATENISIIIFDIIWNQKINEIKNAHNIYITNFRYFWDKINNRDLIMSISGNDNNLKVWDFKNLYCISNIKNINNTGALDSACIFNYNNQNYILTTNDTDNDNSEDKEADINPESAKIYEFNGNMIKELKDSNYRTFFVDTYYDTIQNKTFIITGNEGFVQSYDYEKNERYFRYSEYPSDENETFGDGHCSIIINSDKNMTRLFETSWDGNIRIWNFHLGELITKVNIGCLQGICLSNNNNYLFVGCDNYIKIINLKNGKITNSLKSTEDESKEILTLKRIIHPKHGEMLLSQSSGEYQIKFWLIDNIINE